jgi:hypothetical protein
MERILAAWLRVPELRLGQLVYVAVAKIEERGGVQIKGDTFYIEDFNLAEACEGVQY